MRTTSPQSGTDIYEIVPGIHRISTPVPPTEMPGGVTVSKFPIDYESGSPNDWRAIAPRAKPSCGLGAAMISVTDLANRPPVALADGAELSLGTHRVRWLDAPNLPHNGECGCLFETATRTLLCGALRAHGGAMARRSPRPTT